MLSIISSTVCALLISCSFPIQSFSLSPIIKINHMHFVLHYQVDLGLLEGVLVSWPLQGLALSKSIRIYSIWTTSLPTLALQTLTWTDTDNSSVIAFQKVWCLPGSTKTGQCSFSKNLREASNLLSSPVVFSCCLVGKCTVRGRTINDSFRGLVWNRKYLHGFTGRWS